MGGVLPEAECRGPPLGPVLGFLLVVSCPPGIGSPPGPQTGPALVSWEQNGHNSRRRFSRCSWRLGVQHQGHGRATLPLRPPVLDVSPSLSWLPLSLSLWPPHSDLCFPVCLLSGPQSQDLGPPSPSAVLPGSLLAFAFYLRIRSRSEAPDGCGFGGASSPSIPCPPLGFLSPKAWARAPHELPVFSFGAHGPQRSGGHWLAPSRVFLDLDLGSALHSPTAPPAPPSPLCSHRVSSVRGPDPRWLLAVNPWPCVPAQMWMSARCTMAAASTAV